MQKTTDIVSDAEIERVHGYANFGSISKRGVVNEGVMKYAFGFTSGHTEMTILREHGLIKLSRRMSYDADLTKKGKKYLRALVDGRFAEILAFICEEGQNNAQ